MRGVILKVLVVLAHCVDTFYIYINWLDILIQGALHINFSTIGNDAISLESVCQTDWVLQDHRMQRLSLERVLFICLRNLILINASYHSKEK